MIYLFNLGFLEVDLVDIIDILMVSYLLFQLYKLLKGSVAVKIFIGLLSLYLVYLVVEAAGMQLLTKILSQFTGVGVIAALILFQQEIRKFLLLIGRTTAFNNDRIFGNLPWRKRGKANHYDISPIIEASKTLGGSNTGALIVFAKSSELRFYAESGDSIDAEISKRLVLSIFNKNSPLHDGAMIISGNGRIKAARCILPVTENQDLPASYGLRHRAALGMTEVTDSTILVVSEETGQLSVARNGKMFKNLTPVELRQKLNLYLFEDEGTIAEAERGLKWAEVAD